MTRTATAAHTATVEVRRGARYPYLPACSCGWTHGWGYVSADAARTMAEDHATKA